MNENRASVNPYRQLQAIWLISDVGAEEVTPILEFEDALDHRDAAHTDLAASQETVTG